MITKEKPQFTKVTVLSGKTKTVYYVYGESLAKLAQVLGEIGGDQAPAAKVRRGRKPKAAAPAEAAAA